MKINPPSAIVLCYNSIVNNNKGKPNELHRQNEQNHKQLKRDD